jgi:hypothetical protein
MSRCADELKLILRICEGDPTPTPQVREEAGEAERIS